MKVGSNKVAGKRKHGTAASNSRGHSPASTPAPPDDSATLAIAPALVPANLPGFFTTRNTPLNKAAYRYTACGPSPASREGLVLCRIVPSPPAGIVRFSWEDRSSYVSISSDALAIATDKGFRSARANVPIREGAYYFEIIIEKGAGDTSGPAKGDAFGPHVRLGLARREASLNAPAGFDGYSYGLRDKTGDKVHISQPKPYGSAFGTGDVIGVYVYLPPRPIPSITADQPEYLLDPPNPARIVRKRVPIRYKGQLYFEQMEYAPSKEMEDLALMTKDPAAWEKAKQAAEAALKQKSAPPPGRKRAPPPPVPPPPRPLPRLRGSKIAFFKNGECQGSAFEDLFDYLPLRHHAKTAKPISRMSVANQIAMARENYHDDGSLGYYPMVSVFGGGAARINAGPEFKYSPPEDIEGLLVSTSHSHPADRVHIPWRPLSERYSEYFEEQYRLDAIEEAIAVAAFEEKQAQAAIKQEQQPQQSTMPVFPAGTLSASTSPRPIYNENLPAPVKRKTGLSNELIPTRDSTGSPEPTREEIQPESGMHEYVKQEEDDVDAEASPDPELEGNATDDIKYEVL